MLEFNDRLYAGSPREAQDITDSGRTLHGHYKPHNGGFLLFDTDNELRAFISRSKQAKMVVSAHLYAGRPRFLFAMSERDEKWLGLDALTMSQEASCIDNLVYTPAEAFPFSGDDGANASDGATDADEAASTYHPLCDSPGS